ncbi:MAG: gamma-glutamyltransferase [Rhodospirillales bacterium]|nr:gamma-glutamyltransferase [Rhodospirillales bacterium]
MGSNLARRGVAVACVAALATSGCGTAGSLFAPAKPVGSPGYVGGFLGAVVADEPQAALVGRATLAAGGDAADAAEAMAYTLAVTLPSRASLGAGGGCLAFVPHRAGPGAGVPQAILFPSRPGGGAGGDRPAAVPMLPRGMYLLHANFGHLDEAQLIAPAERLARLGAPMSDALEHDIGVVAGPLAGDPQARAAFFAQGAPLPPGAAMVQPALAATLARIRVEGVGAFYVGPGARSFAEAATAAGGDLTAQAMQAAIPTMAPAPALSAGGNDSVAFLPLDGGAAARLWQQAGGNPAAMRVIGGDRPASTTFAALDRTGNAVVCAVSLNNLFGTGRMAPGTGVMLAASPDTVPAPLLSAAIAFDPHLPAFRALAGGSGQQGAPAAAAAAIGQALADRGSPAHPQPGSVPDPGRANVIACTRYLPGDPASCGWAVDPRGQGLALGGG